MKNPLGCTPFLFPNLGILSNFSDHGRFKNLGEKFRGGLSFGNPRSLGARMSETVRFGGWIVPNVLCIRDSDGAFHCYILVSGCSLVEKTIIGFSGVLDVIYIHYTRNLETQHE